MPCNTITTVRVKFSLENTDMNVLRKALKKMGYVPVSTFLFTDMKGNQLEFKKGNIESRMRFGQEFDTNMLQKQYSRENLFDQGEKYGWSITEVSEDEFEVERN